MPRNWLYQIALIMPFVFGLLVLHTGFVDWLWYHHYERAYYALATLRLRPEFIAFIGGWQLPVYIIAVLCWWHLEEEGDAIPAQFILLPLGYVPFCILGDILINRQIDHINFMVYPLVIIPVGYVYVTIWVIIAWILGKLRITIH